MESFYSTRDGEECPPIQLAEVEEYVMLSRDFIIL